MKRIAILGSSGSVGSNALRLIADRPEQFEVAALTAYRSERLLAEQVAQFQPKAACLVASDAPPAGWPRACAFFTGASGVLDALDASQPDLVLNAITGAAGLAASEWSLRHGVPLALANKESLVMAGPHLMELAESTQTPILPVDSEHCAIFQCLQAERTAGAVDATGSPKAGGLQTALSRVRKIYLTASGGPFRQRPLHEFDTITPAQALEHPTWDMGPRITVGSATMMNKAFEVIEAHWLFGLAPEQIQVLIHPQSIVHSMVEFVDGSMLAQLGLPDMRVPILYCLSFPERTPFEFQPFDPVRFRNLTFEPVDSARFPAVDLAFECLARGGSSGAVLNAADEVLTGRFLAGEVSFRGITDTVRAVVRSQPPTPIRNLEQVMSADAAARDAADRLATRTPSP